MDTYRTLAAEFRHEIDPIKGSRFVATVAPTPTLADADLFVARVRAELAAASHNCWAYRLGPHGDTFRSSDDGEPSGSAGRPILQQIEGHELLGVTAVVSRWFGGTKLGVGGLMRAYGRAAGQTLDRAPITTVVVTRPVQVVHPYDCTGPIESVLAAHGLAAHSAHYGEFVRLTLDVPVTEVEEFEREVVDRTSGRATIREDDAD